MRRRYRITVKGKSKAFSKLHEHQMSMATEDFDTTETRIYKVELDANISRLNSPPLNAAGNFPAGTLTGNKLTTSTMITDFI
ncbi:hypothetical protein STEG23_033256 [Scotinomys teguina]